MPIRPSSVVVRRPSSSSVVNFSIKSLISQKLSNNFFPYLACDLLPKGHFERLERSNVAPFLLGGNFLKNCLITFLYLCKKLPKEGTNELPKDGFDWITLKVIFQGPKGLKKVTFCCFATFCQFSLKWSDNFSLFLVCSFLGMILINCQEMDLIELFKR